MPTTTSCLNLHWAVLGAPLEAGAWACPQASSASTWRTFGRLETAGKANFRQFLVTCTLLSVKILCARIYFKKLAGNTKNVYYSSTASVCWFIEKFLFIFQFSDIECEVSKTTRLVDLRNRSYKLNQYIMHTMIPLGDIFRIQSGFEMKNFSIFAKNNTRIT